MRLWFKCLYRHSEARRRIFVLPQLNPSSFCAANRNLKPFFILVRAKSHRNPKNLLLVSVVLYLKKIALSVKESAIFFISEFLSVLYLSLHRGGSWRLLFLRGLQGYFVELLLHRRTVLPNYSNPVNLIYVSRLGYHL